MEIPKNTNYQKQEFHSKKLEHLGIIYEIGILERINKIFLIYSRNKVNTIQNK
jgi:hypothetical protein